MPCPRCKEEICCSKLRCVIRVFERLRRDGQLDDADWIDDAIGRTDRLANWLERKILQSQSD